MGRKLAYAIDLYVHGVGDGHHVGAVGEVAAAGHRQVPSALG